MPRKPFCQIASVILLALMIGPATYAQDRPSGMCDLSAQPAATLLLPYFEVELDDPEGLTTLFSINNAWSEPALVNVTFWTDFGIPTINFPVFLTGYDLVTVNLRDVFNGNLPITADESSDPNDSISPHSFYPEWDGSFPSCNNFFPFFINPVIAGNILASMTADHTGEANPTNSDLCAGRALDGRARGFITIDNVNDCILGNPAESSGSIPDPDIDYFEDGGQGLANNNNQLWGDFYLVNPAEDMAMGEPLVHVQAFGDVAGGVWQDGDATFYGRFHGDSGVDNREPLPSIFGVRHLSGQAFSGGTQLTVWREADLAEPIMCDQGLPQTLPLEQRQIFSFSEQEDIEELCFFPGCPVCSPPVPPAYYDCLPAATQRVDINDDPDFISPGFEAGWLYLDLNSHSDESDPRQAWVVSEISAQGRFNVGLPAVHLWSACDGVPPALDFYVYW